MKLSKKDGKKVVMQSHKFYQNDKCKFFPCHEGAKLFNFSCLFCFCPLYPLECWDKDKNCQECVYPHIASNYEPIIAKLTLEHLKRCRKKA